MQIVGQAWLSFVTLTCGSWSEGQHDLYFTVQWFCLISLRLFDVYTSYFGIMNKYDTRFDLKINLGHSDLYFMVQWFCLLSWRLFDVWVCVCVCVFGFNVAFNNFSVISRRCLVVTGSSILTFIVLPHWSIMSQTLDMIPHPVTLSWHWVDQS